MQQPGKTGSTSRGGSPTAANPAADRESHLRGWLTGVGLTGLLLVAASLLAANAVPQSPVSAKPQAPKSATTETALQTISPRTDTKAPTRATGVSKSNGAELPQSQEPFGPPERVKSVAEKAIAPLLTEADDSSDVALVKSALANISGRRTSRALAVANTLQNEGARKLVQWFAYRRINSGVDAQIIEDFRNDNPTWPENALLRQRAEEALLLDNAPPGIIRAFFDKTPPETPAGHAALAAADLAEGKKEDAAKRVRKAWRDGNFGATIEARMMRGFKLYITQDDINWRLNQYLLDDDRYGRSGRLAVIRRMIKALKPEAAAKARARLAVWQSYRSRSKRRLNKAVRAIAAIERKISATTITLPKRKPSSVKSDGGEEQKSGSVEPTASEQTPKDPKTDELNTNAVDIDATDWPYEYHRIQLLRRQGRHKKAWQRLLEAPTGTDNIVAPDHWWEERRVNIFNALYRKKFKTAYQLAAYDAELGPNARNQSNFMAGWIAFRFLGEHEAALTHLMAYTRSADGPRSRAQSHYWLGRLYDVLGDKEASRQAYETSALEFSTFYGQLSRQKIDANQVEMAFPPMPELTPKRIEEGRNADVLQALRFARLAGNPSIVRRLLRAIGKSKQAPHIYQLAAEFAKTTGDTQMAVRIGKGAIFHGVPLAEYAYPTHAFPLFKPLITPPEPAMLYGLARQESEFNTLIKSIVGARGVLQVMPATAHGICRQHRLKCGSRRALTRRLSRDPSYNATLAAAYVTGRLQEFGGSYILAYAGYNAGPGRARYWIGKSGDPRDPEVDPIDWIELIHLEETREYVKKVMANLQIYRARLGKPETALQITRDIERGSL